MMPESPTHNVPTEGDRLQPRSRKELETTVEVLRYERTTLMRDLATITQQKHRLIERAAHLDRRLRQVEKFLNLQAVRIDQLTDEIRKLNGDVPSAAFRVTPIDEQATDLPSQVRQFFHSTFSDRT